MSVFRGTDYHPSESDGEWVRVCCFKASLQKICLPALAQGLQQKKIESLNHLIRVLFPFGASFQTPLKHDATFHNVMIPVIISASSLELQSYIQSYITHCPALWFISWSFCQKSVSSHTPLCMGVLLELVADIHTWIWFYSALFLNILRFLASFMLTLDYYLSCFLLCFEDYLRVSVADHSEPVFKNISFLSSLCSTLPIWENLQKGECCAFYRARQVLSHDLIFNFYVATNDHHILPL